jgi:urease accessory protein
MNKFFSNGLVLMLASLPVAAFAHMGQGDHGFMDGLTHPFLGVDHLLAMLVVGIWSVLHGRNVWLAPICFIVLLTIGTLLGQQGFTVPRLEPLIAASVLVLGVMLTHPFKLGTPAALALVGSFAVFHGMAHGGELSAGTGVLVGIILGSALLHATGMIVAHFFLKGRPRLARCFGQLVAMLGGGLILSSVLG